MDAIVQQPAGVGMDDPQVVSRDEWLAACRQLLAREKEFTRQRDELNAERRRLPMTETGKQYAFEGRHAKASLPRPIRGPRPAADLPLHVRPGLGPTAARPARSRPTTSATWAAKSRDTTLAMVSRALLVKIEPFRQRMARAVPLVLLLRQRLQLRLPRHPRSGCGPSRRQLQGPCRARTAVAWVGPVR